MQTDIIILGFYHKNVLTYESGLSSLLNEPYNLRHHSCPQDKQRRMLNPILIIINDCIYLYVENNHY